MLTSPQIEPSTCINLSCMLRTFMLLKHTGPSSYCHHHTHAVLKYYVRLHQNACHPSLKYDNHVVLWEHYHLYNSVPVSFLNVFCTNLHQLKKIIKHEQKHLKMTMVFADVCTSPSPSSPPKPTYRCVPLLPPITLSHHPLAVLIQLSTQPLCLCSFWIPQQPGRFI